MPTLLQPQSLSLPYRMGLSFIRSTPLSRGKSRRIILNFIKKHITHPIITDFRGVPFILNLDNTTEQKALFGKYNLQELAFLKAGTSRVGATFVDLGANCGFYTQNFLAGEGQNRQVLAIEPNPSMCKRITANVTLLKQEQPENDTKLILECCAIGNSDGEAELDLTDGVGGATIVGEKNTNTITVKIEKLTNILKKHGIDKIDVLKVDIEGYEDVALVPFFTQADPHLFPKNIIIEHTGSENWKEDLFAVLKDKGYAIMGKTRGNLLLTKQ